MFSYYDEKTLVYFKDLRELIREEIAKLIDEVKNKNPKPKPLSIQEVADRYEVSKQTVHNWINKGTIKGFKQGKGRYFHMDEIEKSFAQYRYSDV